MVDGQLMVVFLVCLQAHGQDLQEAYKYCKPFPMNACLNFNFMQNMRENYWVWWVLVLF